MTLVERDLFRTERNHVADVDHWDEVRVAREDAVTAGFYAHLREYVMPGQPVVHTDSGGDEIAQKAFGKDLHDVGYLMRFGEAGLWIVTESLILNTDVRPILTEFPGAPIATRFSSGENFPRHDRVVQDSLGFLDRLNYQRVDVEGITSPVDAQFPLSHALFVPRRQ